MHSPRRPAFTLIELLVVIAIIAILIGLLVPAVQAVRESASRMTCATNLKQLGVAFHNYHTTNKRFPPGFASKTSVINDEGNEVGGGWGWAVHLLPYLEQDVLYRQLNLTQPLTNAAFATVRTTSLPIFLCPSDNPPAPTFVVRDEDGLTLTSVAFANYVGVGGTFEVTVFPNTGTGVLFRNSLIRAIDITDGTSNTLFVGERSSKSSPQTTWVGAVTGAGVPPLNPAYEVEGPPVLVLTNTGTAADRRTPNNALQHVEDTNSQHRGGVNFLFGDGSVRFVPNGVSPALWEALGTRAGGEPVSVDF